MNILLEKIGEDMNILYHVNTILNCINACIFFIFQTFDTADIKYMTKIYVIIYAAKKNMFKNFKKHI